jgi:hypothetical protein
MSPALSQIIKLTGLPRLLIFSIIFIFLTVASNCFASPSAEDLLKRKGFVWTSTATAHLQLHFEPGSFAQTRLEHLKSWEEKAYERNLVLLRTTTFAETIDIFIVVSRERMKQLIGKETNGAAYPATKVVCFVFNEKLDASGAHELMHVMAGNTWGAKFKPWINEGFAGYADDIWYGYRLHDLGKYLLLQKKLIPLEKLISDFDDQPEMISYPQSASFVKFLYERFGVEKVKELWLNASLKDIPRVLGKDVAALEKEWESKLLDADGANIKYGVITPK